MFVAYAKNKKKRRPVITGEFYSKTNSMKKEIQNSRNSYDDQYDDYYSRPGNGYAAADSGRHTSIMIVRIIFIIVLILEVILCWSWLIHPIIPVINVLIENHGTIPVDFDIATLGQDMAHPLGGLSVADMGISAAVKLFTDTLVRTAVFTILFGVTIKVYRVIRTVLS